MIDLMQAVQTAVFRRLDEDAALAALSPVYQHVMQDTPAPMTIVGNIESEDTGGKGEQAERITIEILTVYRGAGRAALLDIMNAQRDALIEHGELEHDGVLFQTPQRILAASDGPAQDGVTYAGISTFIIDAEPA